MRLRVYNTLTRSIEDFEPFDPPLVRMYVCGPTVYDETHIGHARTWIAFDAIRRYLEVRGFTVLHVQNITDIDDKIINRAKEEGRDWKEIADTYTKSYLSYLSKLGVRPHVHPRVTEHIGDIIEFIEKLLQKGFAYESNGSVYFDVTKYPNYGELSKRYERASWRQEEDVLQEKRNPFDFALWKRHKPGEPSWKSPWGPGRPGWHIECSVMSTKYLGPRIDIHGGGQDLIFPHHENERAQSEAALGVRPWVKYWMHTGMLTVSGVKMSKSLKNIVPLKDALSEHDPGTLRTWVLSAHYRTQLDFDEQSLNQAKRNKTRILNVMKELSSLLEKAEPVHGMGREDVELLNQALSLHKRFHDAMSEDFNTSKALAVVMEAAGFFYKHVESNPLEPLVLLLERFFKTADSVYGFSVGEATEGEGGLLTLREQRLIEALIDVRRELRSRKEYQLADMIRSKLQELGIRLVDKGLETKYVIE